MIVATILFPVLANERQFPRRARRIRDEHNAGYRFAIVLA